YEKKVEQNLSSRMSSMGMEDNIFEILVAEQEVYEEKDGETVSKMKKAFPGYVLVQMIMSDEAWYVVRNTPGVTGFVGSMEREVNHRHFYLKKWTTLCAVLVLTLGK